MNINSVRASFGTNVNSPKNTSRRNNFTLPNDTFTRTVSFSGKEAAMKDSQSYDNFKKWAEETDFLSRANDIVQRTGKILGRGFEGTTYEIPDTDNWVIKEYKRCNLIESDTKEPEIFEIDDIAPELNIGQTIARIHVPAGNSRYCHLYYIMKRQKGDNYGVSYTETDSIDKYTTAKHLKSLKIAAELPQTSFDKCVRDTEYITKRGYLIDYINPNNLMIDTDKQQINFIDINDKLNRTSNQHAEVLFSILDSQFGSNFRANAEASKEKAEAEKAAKTIVDKYFTAMKNNNAKFSGDFIHVLLESHLLDGNVKGDTIEEKLEYLRENNLV